MKKYIALFSLIAISMVYSCKEETIEVYGDKNYVSFYKSLTDTTIISFFFYEDDEIDYPVYLNLIGRTLDKDVEFGLEVIDDETTLDKSLVTLADKYVFRAGKLKDTVYFKLKNSSDLSKNKYLLKLRIKDGQGISSVNSPSSTAVYSVSDLAQRPDWWTLRYDADGNYNKPNMTDHYLGEYSDKKYLTFMEATGIEDLSDLVNEKKFSEIRIICLKFQHWLNDQDPKILEEDNSEMKTEVKG